MKKVMAILMVLALVFAGCGGGGFDEPEQTVAVNPNSTDNDNDGYSENQGDCNDNDSKIYPGAMEICGDGTDQDCNGSDLLCPVQTTDTVENFADDYEKSMDEGSIDLYMSRISENILHNGQNYDCYAETIMWYLAYYNYKQTSYAINLVSYESKDGKQLANVNASIRHVYAENDIVTNFRQDDILIFEGGKWKLYGNQQAYSPPVLLNIFTFDNTTKRPTSIFTSADSSMGVSVSLDNVADNSTFIIRYYQPDGSLFTQTPFSMDMGDYPDCARQSFSWEDSFSLPNYIGKWRVELSYKEIVLKQIEFEYK